MFLEAQSDASGDDRIAAFVGSDLFDRLFREGMDLVEETASYLDGEGRSQAKRLERAAALSYASESMRLTTRLMQAASWLLVQRAVREGEMTSAEARDPKYRLGARTLCATDSLDIDGLPVQLADLLARSHSLYARVDRLDTAMFADEPPPPANPVNAQLERLQAMLSGREAG
jgi:regulator of CtrA degradation